jgi:acyl-CoA dehydrogenase
LELTLDSESATAAVVHTGTVYDAADRGGEPDKRLLRILTPLIKMAICKRARWSTGESMEVRGGNGYIEDWVDPRLLRDAHLGSIWEGATSVLALDVLRAVTRDAAHDAFFADVESRLRSVADGDVRRAASLLLPLARRLRTSVDEIAALPDDERELPMLELCDRLYQLYAASLLVEEAGAQAALGSYRKLVVAAEFIRRRLLRSPEGWTGPRPGSGTWFRAVLDWQPVPPGAATALLDHLASAMPVAVT